MQQEAEKIKQQISSIDENVKITKHYIKQEENTMKANQQQIEALQIKIKFATSELNQMQAFFKRQRTERTVS